ncbi:MAG TPA: GNAT family N-acetyltransferase [Lachnospiraceae bacterium]|nr:GNAT family N-acetyltransferase [Lachnospiraceae bacterium]
MKVVEVTEMEKIAPLFGGWQESTIWSCLEGTMGKAYSIEGRESEMAKVVLGDFCFPAGIPCEELLLDTHANASDGFQIIVPGTKEMGRCIEQTFQERAEKKIRYAIKKEGDIFDRTKLQVYIDALTKGYRLSEITKPLYEQSQSELWSRDFCCNFKDYKDFKEHALGYVVLKDGKIVAGASSYSYYSLGIEIEIATFEPEQRKGLALCCGARLVLAALQKGLYPNWDAANLKSVGLATKLGYHFEREYDSYHICES